MTVRCCIAVTAGVHLRMLKKILALTCISCCLLLSRPAAADEMDVIENDQIVVEYEKSLQAVAGELIRIYPSVKKELEDTFQSEINFRPAVRLIRERKTFQDAAVSRLIVAVAVSGRDLIVIDNSKMKTDPFSLEVTLKHELCHLVLHHITKEGSLPRWFNEGVSQWVSGGITDIIMGENKDLLKQATLSGRLIRLRDLAYRFPEDDEGLLLAYQESKSITDYIDKEFGPDSIKQIVHYLKSGDDIDTAVLRALSIPVYELEEKWHADLRKRFTWFTYLSSHLYQVLFSLTALASIYGFIAFLIRKRKYKDEEEE